MATRLIDTHIDNQVKDLNRQLRQAIKNGSKAQVAQLYGEFEILNLECVSEPTFQEYDRLIDQANDLLYS